VVFWTASEIQQWLENRPSAGSFDVE